jgi:hypothetical protein
MKGVNMEKSISKYTIIDNETGEIVTDNAMFIGKKAFIDKGFRKIFVGFLRDVVMDKEIAGKAIRLLLYVIENLKANDLTIMLYWKIVCEELNITQGTYYNWLNILLDKKIIEKTEIPNMYRLVPFTAVNGQMEKAIKKQIKEQQII